MPFRIGSQTKFATVGREHFRYSLYIFPILLFGVHDGITDRVFSLVQVMALCQQGKKPLPDRNQRLSSRVLWCSLGSPGHKGLKNDSREQDSSQLLNSTPWVNNAFVILVNICSVMAWCLSAPSHTWTNVDLLSVRSLWTYFNTFSVEMLMISLINMHFNVIILLTFMLCRCNVMTLLNNLSGTGAWWRAVGPYSE